MQKIMTNEEKIDRAEKSIQKKFHKQIFSPFAKACKTYKLIEEGDNIAVWQNFFRRLNVTGRLILI